MTEWEWYTDINTKSVFLHLLLMANHKDAKWRGILVKRGQRLTSLDSLSRETGLSVSKIRTAIKKLKSTGELTSKSHSQHTVFTINNYDSYQGVNKQIDKRVTNESQTNDKRLTTNNNDNNENNENNKRESTTKADKSATPTKKFIKPSTNEIHEYMKEKGVNDFMEAEKFFDYWESVGWSRGRNKMKCWKATVRTWLKNYKPKASNSGPDMSWARGL